MDGGMIEPAERFPDMIPQAAELWVLAISTDPEEIAILEARAGHTQAAAVDNFIEDSCWGEEYLRHLRGGRGTPVERHSALLASWEEQKGERE
jgi:hypothetical protein